MILILTSADDATTDHVTANLRRSEFLRLNSEELPSILTLESTSTRSVIAVRGRRYLPTDFTGVWYRRPKAIHLKHRAPSAERTHAGAEFTAALEGFLALIAEKKWINHPGRNALAGHKLEQVQRASSCGLRVPLTLITQDPKALRKFWDDCEGEVIIKPLSTGYLERVKPSNDSLIYTNALRLSDLRHTSMLRRCPTLFQERIIKSADIRVTIIDQDLQAVEMTAQDDGEARLDIRRNNMADVTHRPVQLPAKVSRQLRRLVTTYGLRFAAIDLLRDIDSNYVFLEINPNGQWAWLDLVGASNSRDPLIAALKQG